jgi:hypothetical protein
VWIPAVQARPRKAFLQIVRFAERSSASIAERIRRRSEDLEAGSVEEQFTRPGSSSTSGRSAGADTVMYRYVIRAGISREPSHKKKQPPVRSSPLARASFSFARGASVLNRACKAK